MVNGINKISFFGKVIKNGPTVGSIMAEHKGIGPGFDAVRIGLALIILLWHCFPLVYGMERVDLFNSKFYPVIISLVPMFFCLSGFLVAGSAIRTRSARVFLTNRALRIFPALTVEVFLSAVILAPLVTTLPLNEYFSSSSFYSYFGNIIGFIQFKLPGVFEQNPIPIVNGNLWTLLPEYYCYLWMTALMVSTVIYRRTLFSLAFAGTAIVFTVMNLLNGFGMAGSVFPTVTIVYFFFVGVMFFYWKEYIPVRFSLFLASAVWCYFMISHRLTFLSAFPLAYCVVYVGMLKIPKIPLLQNGDYSYGIYLFSFPIIQVVVFAFPTLNEWWTMLLVAGPLSIFFSALSWHLIEKPALKLKGKLLPPKRPTEKLMDSVAGVR
jgi:peptidoglycan/LPS O-acetylase OafA/YrhL